MRVVLIAKPGHEATGVGRYSSELRAVLEALGHEVVVVHPTVPLPRTLLRVVWRLFGWDLETFFSSYPVWARYPKADVYHITSQNLATLLLLCRPPGKVVVTVHDIIPWLVRDHPGLRIYDHRIAAWFDRLALAGLQRADALVADSAFTQASLDQAGVLEKSVAIPLGVV